MVVPGFNETLGKEGQEREPQPQQQQGEQSERAGGGRSDDLANWSTRVEELVDDGDEAGAVALLETVVGSLRSRSDAEANLGLAAALDDLGRLYASQGFSLKSDDALNSALLIRDRAQKLLNGGGRGRGGRDVDSVDLPLDRLHLGEASAASEFRQNAWNVLEAKQVQGLEQFQDEMPLESPVEEDWETASHILPLPLKMNSSAGSDDGAEKSASKQRGRGSFTYGSTGMYSDNVGPDAEDDDRHSGNHIDHSMDGGASHVLILTFAPTIKTKDLENVVKPFADKDSYAIRWIDDTKALAVFSSPSLARDALLGIKDARFKVRVYMEFVDLDGRQPSVKDLAPPAPRPASSARVAERMIAKALSGQGVSRTLLAKNRHTVRDVQKQEQQRRERLQRRAQLRDEAWGSDEE